MAFQDLEPGNPLAVEVSVVVPMFNEVESIGPLYGLLRSTLDDFGRKWEVIFIDDGSADRTFDVLQRIHSQDPRVKVIQMRRNFGQTAALAAGFSAVSGEIVVAIDGDLQNDPGDIPMLIQKLEEGYDLAGGWRQNRKDPLLSRKLPSKMANWLISAITGVHLHDYGCTLKVMRKEIARELQLYGEMHRFIPAIAASLGARIVEVPVNHHPRKFGRSKYGITRTVRVLLDLLTVKFLSGYSTRPGHVFGMCGLLAMATGGSITLYLGLQRLLNEVSLADRPLLLLGILLLITGVQFITMGFLGEMLSRTYHESQGKTIYSVRKTLGLFGAPSETSSNFGAVEAELSSRIEKTFAKGA